MLKRALANTPILDNNMTTIWTTSRNIHICSPSIWWSP